MLLTPVIGMVPVAGLLAFLSSGDRCQLGRYSLLLSLERKYSTAPHGADHIPQISGISQKAAGPHGRSCFTLKSAHIRSHLL